MRPNRLGLQANRNLIHQLAASIAETEYHRSRYLLENWRRIAFSEFEMELIRSEIGS